MINVRKTADNRELREISELARVIWTEHFTPIIGAEQVEYMLEKFQSYSVIKKSVIHDGYIYYAAFDRDKIVGYMGIHPERSRVFLSKIYVEKSYRGQGLATAMLDLVKYEYADKKYFYLTVNRNNVIAIDAYKAMGFYIEKEQVTDIGNGFVMDDYVMRLDDLKRRGKK